MYKYQHIERFGTDEVDGIQYGTCYVFPKVDGSNGSVWWDGGLKAANRNRDLSLEEDNLGFYAFCLQNKELISLCQTYPHLVFFGEWLCLSGDTIIRKTSGGKNSNYMTLKEMYEYDQKKIVDNFKWTNKDGMQKTNTTKRPVSWWGRYGYPSLFSLYQDEDKIRPNKMKKIVYAGSKDVYEITTRKGFKIKTTLEHPFFTPVGFKKLKELKLDDCVAVSSLTNTGLKKRSYGKGTNKIFQLQADYKKEIGKCEVCGLTSCLELHHKDGDHKNNTKANFEVLCRDCHIKVEPPKFKGNVYDYEFDKIILIKYIGVEDCYDISMDGTDNEANFVANGFIVHNCPHSLTAYREDAWNKFYIFDVQEKDSDTYIHYEAYSKLLDVYDVNYITPICTIVDGTYEQFCNQLEKNVFLMKDGLGAGEGVCCKNYEYKNKYGRQTWAKIVRNEFKEIHKKVMGLQEIKGKLTVEKKIVDKYCTSSFIDKTFAKINVDGWSSKKINELFGRVFYDLIIEESWNFIKEFKLPIIDYKELNRLVINKVKECKKELFTNFSGGLKCKK